MSSPATPRPEEPANSDLAFDLVERLVARGYTVDLSIQMGAGGLTLHGEPTAPEPAPEVECATCGHWAKHHTEADGCTLMRPALHDDGFDVKCQCGEFFNLARLEARS